MKKINLLFTFVAIAFFSIAQSYLPVQHGGNMVSDLTPPDASVQYICLDEATPPDLVYSAAPNISSLPDFAYVIETPYGLTTLESGNLELGSNAVVGWLQPGDQICVSGVAYDAVAIDGILQAFGANPATCISLGINPTSCANIQTFVNAGGTITDLQGALDFVDNLDVPFADSTEDLRDVLNIVNGFVGSLQFAISNGGYGKDYCYTIDDLCNPIDQCNESLGTLTNPLGVSSYCQDDATPPTLTYNVADNTSGLPDFAYVIEANGGLVIAEADLDLFSSTLNFVEAGQQFCVTGVSYDVVTVNAVAGGLAATHAVGPGCTNLGIAATSCDAILDLYDGPDNILGNADDGSIASFTEALDFMAQLDVPPPNSVDNLITGLNIINGLVGTICFAVTNNGLGNDYCIDITGPCNPIAQCAQSLGTLTAPSSQTTICRDGSDEPTLVFQPGVDNTSTLPDFAYLITSSDGTVFALDSTNYNAATGFQLSPGASIGYLDPGASFCVSGVAFDIVTINTVAGGLAATHAIGPGCTNLGIAAESCDAILDLYEGPDGILGTGDDGSINSFNEALDFTSQLAVPTPDKLGNIIVGLNTINGLVGTICFAMTNGGNGADYCYSIADCSPMINPCSGNTNMPPLVGAPQSTICPDGSDAPTLTYANPNNSGLPDYAMIIEGPNGLEVFENSGSVVLSPSAFCADPGESICVSGVAFNLAVLNPVVAGLAAIHTLGATSSGCVNLGIAASSCDNIFLLIAGADSILNTSDDGSIGNFQEALDFTEQLDIYPSTSIENLILGLETINGLVGTICFSMSNNGVGNDYCYNVACEDVIIHNEPYDPAGLYNAHLRITSSVDVEGSSVTYHAGQIVELMSGFDALQGVDFEADIEDCK